MLWIIKMIKYNIIVCRYDKMLVNVAAYVIPDSVCVCVCVCVYGALVRITQLVYSWPPQYLYARYFCRILIDCL